MKYVYIFLLYTLSLNAQLLTPTMTPQTFGGLRQFSQNMSGRANYNNRGGFIQTVIPNRMIPYAAGIQNQQRPQPQQQAKQPLRAHNNRYPVNRSNTMGFGSYRRINLRDSKAQALAAQRYKTTLATLRISLRGYRMNFGKPTTPPNNNNNNNGGTTPTPQPPTTPGNNGNGQVGIGGGPGPVPPTFPGGPDNPDPGMGGPDPGMGGPDNPDPGMGGPDNPDPGMPDLQPRPAIQFPPIPAIEMSAPELR